MDDYSDTWEEEAHKLRRAFGELLKNRVVSTTCAAQSRGECDILNGVAFTKGQSMSLNRATIH